MPTRWTSTSSLPEQLGDLGWFGVQDDVAFAARMVTEQRLPSTSIGGMDAITTPPAPVNEPNLDYAPGSAERAAVEAELAHLAASPLDLTAAIGGDARRWAGAPRSRSCSRTTTRACSAC